MALPKTQFTLELLEAIAISKTTFESELLDAVKKGEISTVQDLLNNNNIDRLKDARYLDCHVIAAALSKSNVAIAKLLIEKGFRVCRKSVPRETILHLAVKLTYIDLINTILAKGASQDILTPNFECRTPLHLAINKNQTSIVELLLAQLDIKTFDEKYFLQYTIQKHTIPVASQLIGNGFSLTKETKEHEHFKTLDVMLSFCSVKNMKPDNYDVLAPAYIASICGNLEVIKKYAESGLPIDVSLEFTADASQYLADHSGFTLLHFAVKHVKLEIVEFLLSVGADILVLAETGSSPLHLAFEAKEIGIWKTWKDFHDNNSIIDLLLANTKFNSNPINKHGLSHFHIACSRDEPAIVEHFLKLGASINQPVKSQCHFYKKFSPLHFAAKFRCVKTMEILLKKGADVKQKDHKKMTALHIAVNECCLETVSLLLQYGAEIDSADSHGKTPVHWAFENSSYKILDALLSVPNVANSNPVNSQGVTHFHIACTRNNVNVVKSFIDYGVLLDTCIPIQQNNKQTFIYDSDSEEYISCISYNSNWSGYSPLHLAICHNKPDIVQLLLDNGAKVEVKNEKGCDPLHMACQYPCEMFTEFIENILIEQYNHGGTTERINPLTDIVTVDGKFACGKTFGGPIGEIDWSLNRSEHLKIIKSMYRTESDANRIDNDGASPIIWACWVDNDPVQEMQSTLVNNLNCSKALSEQITKSLSKELQERKKLIIDHFLKLNANLDKCSRHGSILHSIAMRPYEEQENVELMELFIKRGANVNAKNDKMWTPLHCAVSREKKNLVRVLLDNNVDVDCANSSNDNLTPLLLASKGPSKIHIDIIVLLANHGANVNAKRSDETTALHDLVSLRTKENESYLPFSYGEIIQTDTIVPAINALMRGGANVNCQDSEGNTPLHVACRNYNHRFASMLLDHGADIDVEDNNGESVSCHVYNMYRELEVVESTYRISQVVNVLGMHIVKMKEIGLPISKKTLLFIARCGSVVCTAKQQKLMNECRVEVKVLQDTKIHDSCTLYDMMFKNENTLSRLVKNPAFKDIVQSESFDNYRSYGYLIKLKYQKGLQRGELLPKAKWLLNNLARLELPETCTENISKYFDNIELKESIEMLCVVFESFKLDLKI